MKNFSLKALGAFIFAAGLVAVGVAAPANATTMNVTATASGGTVGTSGTNAYPISITFTPETILSDSVEITLPAGWSAVNSSTLCANTTMTSSQATIYCDASSSPVISFNKQGASFWTSVSVTVQFGAGTLNTGSNRVFNVTAYDVTTAQDAGSATLAGGVSSFTVTFDANSGTGTTAAQTASTSTALTANGFSRSGYSFTGWNTAANGSGNSYANGASYAFTSSTTLYAQWTATLANTGISSSAGISLLAGGLSLALVGVEMNMIARRKRSN